MIINEDNLSVIRRYILRMQIDSIQLMINVYLSAIECLAEEQYLAHSEKAAKNCLNESEKHGKTREN